jgi:transcriptional regulator with XRE-family HTH domain/predicted phosphodiesterase
MSNKSVVETILADMEKNPSKYSSLPGVTTNWSAAKLMLMWTYLEEEMTQDEIAEKMDVDRSTISRKDNSMDWSKFIAEARKITKMSKDEFIDYSAESQRASLSEKKASSTQKKHITVLASIKNIEERLVNEAARAPEIVLPKFSVNKNSKGTPEEMVLILSDAHVGLEFTNRETGGLGEYNPKMFLDRMDNLRRGLIEIYNLHSKLYKIPKLHIICLGDMVQGGNLCGEWGPANICLPLDQQTVMAANAVSELILSVEPLFEEMTFTGVVGNHGRGGATKNSDKISANWDNMVYAILEARLAEHKNISVTRSESWWSQKKINGTEVMLVHGDHIQGNITSLKSEEAKYQALATSTNGRWFNIMCIGHFHTHHEIETPKGMILVNGSFVGGDTHSLQHMRTMSRPTQTLFGVHPKHGMTWKYRLDMDLQRD